MGLTSFAPAVSAQDSAKPLIVTSIKPLAIIAKSAFKDRVRVEYIMPAGQSPHDYVVKLSDIRKLSSANLVFWIGPDFEVRAAKQFAAVPATKLVTAMNLIYPDHEVTATDSHDHHDQDIDPHIWLSSTFAKQLVENLSKRLNLQSGEVFSERAQKITEDLLVNAKKGNYVVHHQGFGYFVEEFELQSGLSIRDMRGKQQGAKTQYNLRLEGKKRGVSCVFIEPQHGHKDAMAVAKDLSVPTTTIDILAVASDAELPSYESYIYGLATQFSACFK
ncbi:MAG: metal ABC transporter substrate-binding protein [Porticoccaceae bacterium]|nr:metal ABC transporter substrate-binding protein [Porticoccaceae bacterium]